VKKRPNNLFCLALGFMIGFGWGWLWESTTRKIGHLAHLGGYHFHHSLYGIVSLFLIPVGWYKNWLENKTNLISLTIDFSLGVIIQHSIRGDRFKFITKD